MQKYTGIFSIGLALTIGISSENSSYADIPTPTAPTHSTLFDSISLAYTGVVEGTSFPYYSQAQRVQTITDLVQSIQSDYSLLLYKQHTLGVDIVQIGQAALTAEQSIPDVFTTNEQATGNLQFLDRVRKITANFQDSHFQLDAVDSASPVSLGFVVSNISGKYLVTSVRPAYLANKTLGFDFSAQIAVGDEVVSIDGQDPLTAAQALKPYFPASSDLYRTNAALFSLTSRDFALPAQATSTVVLNRNGSTVSLNLPWGAATISRTDEATYLKNINITPSLQNLSLTSESVFAEAWRTEVGTLKNKIDFADVTDSTTPVVTVGTLDTPTGQVGYLQIQTFMITALTQYQLPAPAASPSSAPSSSLSPALAPSPAPSSASAMILNALAKLPSMKKLPNLSSVRTIMDTAPKPNGFFAIDPTKTYLFSDFIDSVIATFKAQSLPLILDMRYNPGGDISEAIALVSDLTQTGKTISPLSTMFRITNLAWESIDTEVAEGTADPASLDPLAVTIAAAFTDAIKNGSSYSEVLPTTPLANDKAVGGYDQKVVMLTSSYCVSACDATALLLKTAGRATIMGEPTNGTGAGFFSSFEVPDFTDTNHIIVAHLPNSLFGRPLLATENATSVSVESIEAENHPTQPDVLVQPSLNDVQNGNSDIIAAAIAKVTGN